MTGQGRTKAGTLFCFFSSLFEAKDLKHKVNISELPKKIVFPPSEFDEALIRVCDSFECYLLKFSSAIFPIILRLTFSFNFFSPAGE